MVTVYRLEKPDGRGPYWYEEYGDEYDKLNEAMIDAHNRDHRRPAPPRDGFGYAKVGWVWQYRYGFKSLWSLELWFKGYLEALTAKGYQVVQFHVDRRYVQYGQRQVAFMYERARRGAVIR